MSRKIAIIGGGLSGLATAFYLQRDLPDADITLLESSDRLGGVITTETVETNLGQKFTLDHGADMFATEAPGAIQLCRDLGVEDTLLVPDTANAGAMIVRNGQLVPIPDGFVLMRATKTWPVLRSPLLSWRGKLRFLCERWKGNVAESVVDSSGDVSVADFVRHRLGAEVLDRLVGPLVAGIYTADIEKLSMNATMAPIAAMQREHGSLAKATKIRRLQDKDHIERNSAGARYEKFRGFPDGMRQLIDHLANAIGHGSICTRHAVTAINRVDQAWQVILGDQKREFDQIVLATPARIASQLLKTVADIPEAKDCQDAADTLASIESASTAIVVLCVPKSQIKRLPKLFGFVVPRIENRKVLAVSFASHKYPSRCPDDHTIIRVFVGGAMQSELLEQTDQQLVEMVQQELADLIGMSGPATLTRVVRWNDAMPQYHVGHLARAEAVEAVIERIEGLHLATNALRGVGIAPVISRARKLAASIAESTTAASGSPTTGSPTTGSPTTGPADAGSPKA